MAYALLQGGPEVSLRHHLGVRGALEAAFRVPILESETGEGPLPPSAGQPETVANPFLGSSGASLEE